MSHLSVCYQDRLREMIEKQISKCERSLFIFDEIDKMPGGLIDTIKPYLDYHEALSGVDYRHAIFIFLRYKTLYFIYPVGRYTSLHLENLFKAHQNGTTARFVKVLCFLPFFIILYRINCWEYCDKQYLFRKLKMCAFTIRSQLNQITFSSL